MIMIQLLFLKAANSAAVCVYYAVIIRFVKKFHIFENKITLGTSSTVKLTSVQYRLFLLKDPGTK